MKKLIFTLAALAVIPVAYAQITVNSGDLVFPVGNDTAYLKTVDTASIGALPTPGTDELWDYSGLVAVDSNIDNYLVSDGLHTFTASTGMDDSGMGFGSFAIDATTYFTQDNDGIFTTGYFIPEQGIDIGNTGDTLVLTGDTIDLGTGYPLVQFPLNYSDNNVNNVSYQINFELTYQTYTDDPGYLKRDISTSSFVSGWGQLVYPGSEDTLDVLMVQKSVTSVDSIYVAGMPIPGALLVGTGLEQGQITTSNFIEFITIGLNAPAIIFSTNENYDEYNFAAYSYVPQQDSNISVTEIKKAQLNIYPNPANEYVSIDLSGKNISTSNVIAEIYSLDGRKVADRKVSNGVLSIKDLPNAAYVVRIHTNNEFAGFFRLVKNK